MGRAEKWQSILGGKGLMSGNEFTPPKGWKLIFYFAHESNNFTVRADGKESSSSPGKIEANPDYIKRPFLSEQFEMLLWEDIVRVQVRLDV